MIYFILIIYNKIDCAIFFLLIRIFYALLYFSSASSILTTELTNEFDQ